MSSLVSHSSDPPSPRSTAVPLWTTILQRWRIRQADHTLQGMSDAMLHDIGVARSEIADVTRHGRSGRR